MQADKKVFSSEIIRAHKPLQNDLYELISVDPAKPKTYSRENNIDCNFEPRNDKHYIQKKKNRMKVKTVRDIRNSFEKEVTTYLPSELEKQQNFLLRKIKAGSSRDENTKSIAKNILKCDKPLSRSAFQMLMNLNPEDHTNSIQFVLWNSKKIRVNGSKGGRNKFLCNYDLAKKKHQSSVRLPYGRKTSIKKKRLLQNSITVKFKPGPLSRKSQLDDSYQRYNFGGVELAKLPKPGLEIQPTYGVGLDPSITTFLQTARHSNGTISEKWAEFTVAAVGTVKNERVVQNEGNSVTFDLKYDYDQRQILMRCDTDHSNNKKLNMLHPRFTNNESEITDEVSTIVKKMLDAVEISLLQDSMYTGEEEPREIVKFKEVKPKEDKITSKDKIKKRCGELSRLDVTVIRLPEESKEEEVDECLNEFCTFGCICASLQGLFNLKQHCGYVECMFECKCDFSKYKAADSFDSDCSELIPGLLNLDKQINSKLCKEEQKFHQTVVMAGDKSIVLKPKRRNWKASKKYGDFFTNLHLKTQLKTKKVLSVVDVKLNCENIEPWCMVHNLYKCFCKCKFIDSSSSEAIITQNYDTETLEAQNKVTDDSSVGEQTDRGVRTYANKRRVNGERISIDKKLKNTSISECSDTPEAEVNVYTSCARVKAYTGRKFADSHYSETHKKILEMEKNDSKLQKKIMNIVNKAESTNDTKNIKEQYLTHGNNNALIYRDEDGDSVSNDSTSFSKQVLVEEMKYPQSYSDIISAKPLQETPGTSFISSNNNETPSKIISGSKKALLPNKSKIKTWLESSYKHYKTRMDQGIKVSLDPPKLGKVALYPWEFILSRYREKKNLFLISSQTPYRVFMAIDINNDFFENCINIDDIRFAELNKYPNIVRNLLTNATELKDNFCILCGLAHCWELIGSVTKIKEQKENGEEQDKFVGTDISSPEIALNAPDFEFNMRTIQDSNNEALSDTSKWFVMTVENDFTEIQFYNKGFFVKYESIIKAINVARMSGKTVRLSSQKCLDQNNPQFGIYAIPNTNEYSVFLGPYDKHEPLGIETVKTVTHIGKLQRTRGVWITTKKVDNIKVIDNPLSFMPPRNVHPSKIVSLQQYTSNIVSLQDDCDNNGYEQTESLATNKQGYEQTESLATSQSTISSKVKKKLVKPIKIRKTNGFYHLAPKGFLQQVFMSPSQSQAMSSEQPNANIQQTSLLVPLNQSVSRSLLMEPSTSKSSHSDKIFPTLKTYKKTENKKPVAEIAPQIKIIEVYSESANMLGENVENKKSERGMFVLRPEEINKKLMEQKPLLDMPAATATNNSYSEKSSENEELNQDIENFIATTEARSSSDIFVISDEEERNNESTKDLGWKQVLIECKNSDKLGLIRGRKNAENELSFEFPGFKYTEFYKEDDAFSKISQVLSRKIYIPKNFNLEWHAVESVANAKTKHFLKSEDLGLDFVLTKKGLRHKRELMAHNSCVIRENLKKSSSSEGGNILENRGVEADRIDKASDLISDFEDMSCQLDLETTELMNEFQKTKGSLRRFVNVPCEQVEEKTDVTQNITIDNILTNLKP